MALEVYIEEEIEVVATRTNTALQTASFPHEVFFMYGHIVEVVSRLKQAAEGKTTKVRYPLIVLFTDIPVKKRLGFYGEAKLQIVIVHHTEQNYTAPDRMTNVFKPILEPIKKEFLYQLGVYERFTRPAQLAYTQIRHYFWGSQLNKANPFNDRLDAIELRDIEVIIKENICALPAGMV